MSARESGQPMAMNETYAKVEPARLKAMGPICKRNMTVVNDDIEHVHCN